MFGVSESKEPVKGEFAKKFLEELYRMKDGKSKHSKIETGHVVVHVDKVRDYMIHLDELGWSELIDSRWKEDITNIIKEYDPNVRQEDLEELYKLILV